MPQNACPSSAPTNGAACSEDEAAAACDYGFATPGSRESCTCGDAFDAAGQKYLGWTCTTYATLCPPTPTPPTGDGAAMATPTCAYVLPASLTLDCSCQGETWACRADASSPTPRSGDSCRGAPRDVAIAFGAPGATPTATCVCGGTSDPTSLCMP